MVIKIACVPSATVKNDSLLCRLYPIGKMQLMLEGQAPIMVNVQLPVKPATPQFKITNLATRAMIKLNEQQQLTYTIQNIDGLKRTFNIPVTKNDSLIFTDTILLEPGEKKVIKHILASALIGFQTVSAGDQKVVYKVYKNNVESLLLDLSPFKLFGS